MCKNMRTDVIRFPSMCYGLDTHPTKDSWNNGFLFSSECCSFRLDTDVPMLCQGIT